LVVLAVPLVVYDLARMALGHPEPAYGSSPESFVPTSPCAMTTHGLNMAVAPRDGGYRDAEWVVSVIAIIIVAVIAWRVWGDR
jgi:hypothetical protein